MMRPAKRAKEGYPEEEGQATTEYVLMLLFAISAFMLLKNTILKDAYSKFQDGLSSQMQNLLFPAGEGSLHRLRIR